MGWGAHTGSCKECGSLTTTGDMEICMTCALKKINKRHIVCHSCLTKAPVANIWKYDKNDDTCYLCHKSEKLNARGICQNCFNIIHEIRTDKICPICQMRIIKEDEYSCEECLGNKFL